MTYREPRDPPIIPVNILLDNGGLGDQIARVPVIKYMLKNYSHIEIHLWVPDYFFPLAEHFFGGDKIKLIKTFSKFSEAKPYASFSSQSTSHTTMKTHLTVHGFRQLLDIDVSDIEKEYPLLRTHQITPVENLPARYVVITTGYTSKTRELISQTTNELADYIISKGYVPVFLGNDNAQLGNGAIISGQFDAGVDYTKGLDLRNKTTLLQAGHVMAHATAVVGLDNGLLHLAACTDAYIIGAFTTVKPETRIPYRRGSQSYKYDFVVPDYSLKCKFCQTNMSFMPMHDFRTCFYDDYECTKQITASKFTNYLEGVL